MFKYYYGILFDMASEHSCCQQSMTIITFQLLSVIENRVQYNTIQ